MSETPKCPACNVTMWVSETKDLVCPLCFNQDKALDSGSNDKLVSKYKHGPPIVAGYNAERVGWQEHNESTMTSKEKSDAKMIGYMRKRLNDLNVTDIKILD